MKFTILTLFLYVVALGFNFMPSIKYPDAELQLLNLSISVLFLFSFCAYAVSRQAFSKSKKFTSIISILGSLATLLIFAIHQFENYIFNNFVLDVVSSIQYPLFIFFITPLFGLNRIFQLELSVFSLLMGSVFLVVFLYTTFRNNVLSTIQTPSKRSSQ